MATPETVYTIAYILIAACLIIPPTEFIAIGLTVQNLLSGFLGSEEINFAYYHIKRTTGTLLFHSLLPSGYYLGLLLFTDSPLANWYPWNLGLYWRLYLVCCVILPFAACIIAGFWRRGEWSNHPIAKLLDAHAPRGSNWRAVASSIDVEFRRIDKFTTGSIGRRLIVTDSWVLKTSTYSMHIAHQQDVHLTLVKSDEYDLTHEGTVGVQYLNIVVSSVNERVKPFTIRLNALEYNDLKDKLHTPVRNARNVMIRQSLTDRFLEAFISQVENNPVYVKPQDAVLEPCIGCMQTTANIKLNKLCHNLAEGECVQCYCRPMWCLHCMSKWFASRQNQNEPESWMSSRAPCPTCRSKFCLLDVCKV